MRRATRRIARGVTGWLCFFFFFVKRPGIRSTAAKTLNKHLPLNNYHFLLFFLFSSCAFGFFGLSAVVLYFVLGGRHAATLRCAKNFFSL